MQAQKILAVIDPDDEQHKALSRAEELATKTGAQITAFMSIYDFSYDMTTMLSVEERESMRQAVVDDRSQWLTDLLQGRQGEHLRVDVKVVWHSKEYEAIILEAMHQGFDLIIKGTQRHDTLKSVIFTPTDWQLLRKAPTPVLLVKEHAWPENGKVLAAVNAGCEDDAHRDLNHQVTRTALEYCDTLHAELHLVNSYPGTPVDIAIEIPEFDPHNYNASVKDFHIQALHKHAKEYQVELDNCHIGEGLPEDVIPKYAKKLDAELVVLGTVGRLGIAAALIGNTAEHVIDLLDCDVLAIKPAGFTSPLEKKA